MQRVLLGGNTELFGENVGKIGFVQAHDFAQFGIGNFGREMGVYIFEHGQKVCRLRGNAVVRQKAGKEVFGKADAGKHIGYVVAVVGIVIVAAHFAEQCFVAFLCADTVAGFVDGKIACRGYVKAEMHPVMRHRGVALGARYGKSGNKIQPVGKKFERFFKQKHSSASARYIVHSVIGEIGGNMAPQGVYLGRACFGQPQIGG